MEKVRTTIVLPESLAARLRDCIPPRKRSAFVAEAIERHLMQFEFQEERDRSFGLWKDEDYPHLKRHEDMKNYIADLRDPTRWRRRADSED